MKLGTKAGAFTSGFPVGVVVAAVGAVVTGAEVVVGPFLNTNGVALTLSGAVDGVVLKSLKVS